MRKPYDFMKVAILSFITFFMLQLTFGVMSFMAFGQQLLSPVIDDGFGYTETLPSYKVLSMDTNMLFMAKVTFIISLLGGFYLY